MQMATKQIIDSLNKALGCELAGFIQYMQQSFLLTGLDRQLFLEFFRAQSAEAQLHVVRVGDKIIALGGVPVVEPGVIRQATEIGGMLENSLQLERDAMAAYMAAWEACDDSHKATKFQLEGWIGDEQMHIEELEKLTRERAAYVAK
jgi:bacterioferritin